MVMMEHGGRSALPTLRQCEISQTVESASTTGRAVSQSQSRTAKCLPKGKTQGVQNLELHTSSLIHAWQSLNSLSALLQSIYTLIKTYLNYKVHVNDEITFLQLFSTKAHFNELLEREPISGLFYWVIPCSPDIVWKYIYLLTFLFNQQQ